MILDKATVAWLTLDGKTDRIIWDDELVGFGFRLRSHGARLSRSWIIQYRSKGRTRRLHARGHRHAAQRHHP